MQRRARPLASKSIDDASVPLANTFGDCSWRLVGFTKEWQHYYLYRVWRKNRRWKQVVRWKRRAGWVGTGNGWNVSGTPHQFSRKQARVFWVRQSYTESMSLVMWPALHFLFTCVTCVRINDDDDDPRLKQQSPIRAYRKFNLLSKLGCFINCFVQWNNSIKYILINTLISYWN